MKSEEDRGAELKRYEDRLEQRRKNYAVPQYAKEPVIFHIAVFDRFTTRLVLDGKEVELLISPEPGYPKIEGLPTVYCIDIDHSFFGWLHYTPEAWYISPGKPQEVIDIIRNVVQEYYQ